MNSIIPYWSSLFSGKLLKTQGHFDYQRYPKDHDGAMVLIKKCFDRIVDPHANNRWPWIYLSQKEEIFNGISLKESGGSCFGNCCALGKEIIRRGKILSAAELQAVERGVKFPKRAMGFQLLQTVFNEIRTRYDKAPASERPSQLTKEDKEALGVRAAYFCYQRQLDLLESYGLSLQEVSQFSESEFLILARMVICDIPFDWALKEIFKKEDLKTGKELIQWGNSHGLPSTIMLPESKGVSRPGGTPLMHSPQLIFPKNGNVKIRELFYFNEPFQKEAEFIKLCPEIKQSNFSGFFIIAGSMNPDSHPGHALLLEIDHQTKRYVLYDNNMGFYSGSNLEDCLHMLNKRWSIYKYKTRAFYPYLFDA